MKMTKTQLKELIKEEAQKIKREFQLQDRKTAILSEIKEMYGDMEEAEIDELFGGLFKKQAPKEQRKKFSDEIVKVNNERQAAYKAKTGKTIPLAKWAQPGTPEHEQAIDAAIKLGTGDIYYNPHNKQYAKRKYGVKIHGFGGGEAGAAGTLEESKSEPVKTEEKKAEAKK